MCLNPPAARPYLPRTIRKTELILSGHTKAQMVEMNAAAVNNKQLPAMEPGAMCYMLSREGYLNEHGGNWHPHLMFFFSQTDPGAWGAGMHGSPVVAFHETWEHLTTFLVPVQKWSDGTVDR